MVYNIVHALLQICNRCYQKNIKGDVIISRLVKRGIAVFLCLLFVLGSSVMVYGQNRNSDVYAIALGTAPTQQPAPTYNAIPKLENTAAEKTELELHVSDITPDSAVLSWTGEVTYLTYTILKYNVFTGTYEEYLSTADSSVKLTGLSEDSDYQFAIVSKQTELLGEIQFTTGIEKASVAVTKTSSSAITLSIERSVNASGVVLYKSTDGEEYTELATTAEASYTDEDVEEATTYYYKVKSIVSKGDTTDESDLSAPVQATTLKSFGLPAVGGETKTYAYYTAVTAKGSPQYKLLNSADCTTDPETGIRMVDGRYCVALASYYGTKIGTKYRITLEGDKEIEVILCDQKSDLHTDENHQYAVNNQDIVEFYIERSRLPKGIRGDYGTLSQFSGKIIAIEQYVED